MKQDFTNNMTHELKTPISVADAAIDTLLNFRQGEDKEKRVQYLNMCLDQLGNQHGPIVRAGIAFYICLPVNLQFTLLYFSMRFGDLLSEPWETSQSNVFKIVIPNISSYFIWCLSNIHSYLHFI